MDKGDERLGHQLLARPAELLMPGWTEQRKEPIKGRYAAHIGGQLEQSLQRFCRRRLYGAGHETSPAAGLQHTSETHDAGTDGFEAWYLWVAAAVRYPTVPHR
jgi:hypothetical protein